MGTTTVKNTVQFESLPTSTATSTLGTQLVPNSYAPNISTIPDGGAVFTGTLATAKVIPYTYFYQQLFINGEMTPNILTLQSVPMSTVEASILTFNLGSVVCLQGGMNCTANALNTFLGASLKYVETVFLFQVNSLTTFSFPELYIVQGTFNISGSGLTSINLPKFAYCGNSINFSGAALATINLPALVNIPNASTFVGTNMTNFTFGSTLKSFLSNFVLINAKLTQASVDNILVRLAALDGTNGTTAYSSRTVTLTGGTSSAPSATGLAAKATLQARSCTVTTN